MKKIAIIIVLSVFLVGCTSPKTPSTDIPAVARSEVERGPVKVTVEFSPAKARLSDEPVLTLTFDTASGVKVEKPSFAATLGNFKIINCREPLPKIRKDREIIQQILTLEPTAVGGQTIDPISVTFTDLRPGGSKKSQILETKPLMVQVVSIRGDETVKLGELRGPAAPMALPWTVPVWLMTLIGLAILIAVVTVWFYHRKRREKAFAALILTPEEIARKELEQLAKSGLAENDVKQFFVEITGIIRRYIEQTSGIHAPEQTTEEFLNEIHRARIYPSEVNGRLKEFLESADLVKFAAHHPRREDIDENFRRAERFIVTTRLPSPIGKGAGGEDRVEDAPKSMPTPPTNHSERTPLKQKEVSP